MSFRSDADSTRKLIRHLSSSDRAKVQAARESLTILGQRAVDPLIATLEGGNNRLKLHAMPMLALIHDPRAREPLTALLHDREPRIREAACRALAHFPAREAILALEKAVKHDQRAEVRVAAVQSLTAIFDQDHDEALRELLDVLFDPAALRRVRLSALAVIPLLSARERRAVLRKLATDPDEEIAARCAGLDPDLPRAGIEQEDHDAVAQLVSQLASARHDRWTDAMHGLISRSNGVLPPLIAAMRSRHRDPEFASRAAMVLKGLGPKRLKPVADYLDTVAEPLPLEVLVDVVASLEDPPLTYRLRELLDSLGTRLGSIDRLAGPDPYARVRGKAHLALAKLGSRVAIADLKLTLVDPARRIDPDLLTAVGRIGTREELPDLLRAFRREDAWMRPRIREVFWQIRKREKIRRLGPSFHMLARQDREALREILKGGPPRRSGGRMLPGLEERTARFPQRRGTKTEQGGSAASGARARARSGRTRARRA